MAHPLTQGSLHRTAKYFMDSGRVETAEAAVALLRTFGLTIYVGEEIATSADHQIALLTLLNTARRTLLGGIDVIGLPNAMSVTRLAPDRSLIDAVRDLGGRAVSHAKPDWPSALIGSVNVSLGIAPCWQLTWDGWRGGVVPVRDRNRLSETKSIALAPAVAAAVCAAEAFSFHAGDHPMVGRRSQGLSLWNPGSDWLAADPAEPDLTFLPSRLWFIGLGNLGQAFAWLIACLPYEHTNEATFVLQDFDRIALSNDSTSLLSFVTDVGRKKARVVANWLETRGFQTMIEERRFGPWTQRMNEEPGAALCGVDNALARAALEKAGFGLVVEAGLGAGPQGFRNIFMHSFPASRTAEDIWTTQIASSSPSVEAMPAYQALKRDGMDGCGLTQLASRTVGVPFVGLIAAALAISELLRRLHGGQSIELASLSAGAMEHVETVALETSPYAFGHVRAAPPRIAKPNAACEPIPA